MSQADPLLAPTRLLDFESPAIAALLEAQGWKALPPDARIGAIYDFVRNQIAFGYNRADEIPASQVLADGFGQCNTKGTLLMALLRGAGIRCRLHGFTIHKALQRGVVPELVFPVAPAEILHSWIEVETGDTWIDLEGFILDAPYLAALQRTFSDTESLCGYPSVMCVVPRFNIEDIDPALGSGTHPAFIVGGVQKSEIFVGKFLARVHDNHALSMPGQDPSASINFDTADARCSVKGPGWHMMTNAEWSAVALWCWKNGFMPRGNTKWGRDHAQTYETGRRQDGGAPGDATGTARTLTGSGPASWFHDNSPAGIADLTGNVWEWQRGLRLVDGEIQIIPDNNAAATDADHSDTSTLWRAIMPNGTLTTVPIFLLVPQVKLRKRLDLARDAERAIDVVPGRIEAGWVSKQDSAI